MYNIFYIYTNKHKRPSNTLMLSCTQRPYKPRPYKQPNEPHQQAQNASHLYMAKCKSRIMYQAIQLATCTYAAILKNCIMRSVFQSCLCFVTTLKMFCNLFVICRAKWAHLCVGKLKIDVIRAHTRPPKLCRLDEATLFYIFAHLVNGLINFLAQLTIWLIEFFGILHKANL